MEDDRTVKIMTAASIPEAEQIVQALKDNGIPAYRRGGVMDMYMGNSMEGQDIIIPRKDQDAARRILEEYKPIQVNGPSDKRYFSKNQMAACWILLLIILAICLLPVFLR